MLYNVAQLLKSPVGADLRAPIEGTLSLNSDDITLVAPVTGHVRLQRTNQGIIADGTLTTTVQLQCVRCLDTFTLPLEVPFSEVYLPTIDVVTGQPLPNANEDDVFPIDEHHHLDLSEPFRQQIILAVPMQPLCSETCAGLCPVCGNNRNTDPCTCEAQDATLWSALADLKLDFSSEPTEN